MYYCMKTDVSCKLILVALDYIYHVYLNYNLFFYFRLSLAREQQSERRLHDQRLNFGNGFVNSTQWCACTVR